MRGAKTVLAGVLLVALAVVAAAYGLGRGPGLAGPSDPTGPAVPSTGETFVYGEILAVDHAGRILTIDQHMEPGSVDVGATVRLAQPVDIRKLVDGHPVIPMELVDLRAGLRLGMILRADGLVRAVIVE